jgi:polysaccharide export outer membrane protein
MRSLFRFLLIPLIALAAAAPSHAAQSQAEIDVALRAQAQTAGPSAAAQPAQPTPDAGYILGPGDVVEVDVLGQSEFKTRARIRTDGTIPLPFLGNVVAQGQTPSTFAERVAAALTSGGYYTTPVVGVEVVSYASRYVIVLGAVAQPGLQPVDRDYRLSEILARVGGVRGDGADYVMLRRASGEELKLDFNKIAMGGASEDPLVAAGDKIFVPTAETFYIYGQVNAPGAYALKDAMTLRKAIARSGGLTSSGSDKRVSVFRGGEKVKLGLNEAVQAGDVIVIGERFF